MLLTTAIVDPFFSALSQFLSTEAAFLLLVGTVIGLIFGALPGLGGAVALTLLIPITFGMDSTLAFILLTSAAGGVAFGGSISAILINVPGTGANAATILDGHPLATQGRAKEAIATSAISSALGAIIGLIFLVLAIPFLRQILLLFGPPEFFTITLAGLVMIAFAIRSSLLNGLIAAGMGITFSFVGFDYITGGSRFTFGFGYLYDGIGLIPLIIGIFAISEMIDLLVKNKKISQSEISKSGSILRGFGNVFKHRLLLVQSSLIGVVIGLIPGVGGSVANFISYSAARYTAKDASEFGRGDIRGLIATEAANDAKDGGALIPTIGFGIPGSGIWAIMLGAFTLHGVRPGPQLLGEHVVLVFILIISLLFSNLLTSTIGTLFSDWLAKITITPPTTIAPIIIVISLFGAYATRQQILDLWMAVAIGIFGYLMIRNSISRIAFIMGAILGPIAERTFHQSIQISGGEYAIFITRPISGLILAGIAVLLVFSVYHALTNVPNGTQPD